MTRPFRFIPVLLIFLASQSTSMGQCSVTVDAGEDIYLCAPPSPTQLNGSISGEYLDFTWTPNVGPTLTPTVSVFQSTFYVLSVTVADLSNNLVMNGDFESGNTSFTSDYLYNPGDLVPEGVYDVIPDPSLDHPDFAACADHTSGAGNMMVVNGAGTPNQNVWCQTVTINPNEEYVLSAWATSVVANSPALLQFSINGSPIGPIFSPGSSLCSWQQYFETWNSGPNSSATICIVNQNTTLGGNDFALDDIVFAPVCIETDTVHIEVVNVTATAVPSIVTLPCDGTDITLSGVGSSSGPDVTYLWETFSGNITGGETTLTPTVNAAGEYTLTVSFVAPDGTVCSKMATVNVILSPNPLAAWITPPSPLGCGSSNTTLIGNSSQSGFSTYSWSTFDGNIVSGDNQKNATVNQIGTYTLVVTNSNTGCTATAEVDVTATTTPPLAMAAVADTLTCYLDTISISSAGSTSGANISYTWTTIGGHFASGINGASVLVDSIGTYILNVTNSTTNCTSRDTVIVIGDLDPPYMFLPPQQQITCTVDTIAMIVFLNPPPFVLINWTASNGGHIVSGQFTPNPQVDSAGDYSVSIQNPINGCFTYGDVAVSSNMNEPTINIVPPAELTCAMPNIQISGNGSSSGPQYGYSWTSSNGGNIVSGDTTLNPTINAPGDYSLFILDSLNGCFISDTISVSADTNIVVVNANAPDTLSCNTAIITLNANGSSSGPNFTYLWTSSNGNITSGEDGPNPTVDGPGIYQLLITNTANGCTGTDIAIAQENITPPQIAIDPPAQLTCSVTALSLMGQNNGPAGSYTYNWTASNGGNITSGESTLSPSINAPGTYTLTCINTVNGCSSTATADVTVAMGTPIATTAVPGPLTCVQLNQTVDGTGSSNGPGYSYDWTAINGGNIVGPNNAISISVDAPGSYILSVTNIANGCVIADTIDVLQNIAAPMADAGLPDTLTCNEPNANLLANGPGPSSMLQFNWTTPNGQFISNTDSAAAIVGAPGNYFVLVTDPSNGCSTVDSVLVFEDLQTATLDLNPAATLTCTLLSQNLLAQNMTQPGNFSYVWTAANGGNIVSSDSTLSPLIDAAGSYTLVATNLANGCTATISGLVVQDTIPPNLNIAAPGQITCANPNQTVQAQNLSLPGNFSYSWTASNGGNIFSGNNSLNPVVDAGGDYNLVTTNLDNGCSSSSDISVLQDTNPPSADAGLNDTLTCNLNSLNLSGSGAGAPNLNFSWVATNGGNIVSGGNSNNPLIDAPGTYTLTVLNPVNGCSITDVVDILNDANAPSADAGVGPTLTCTLTQSSLNATASMGADFTYSWSASNGGNIMGGGSSLSPSIDEPGLYTLLVTNTTNGCTITRTVTVLEDITPPIIDAGPNASLTCTVASLALSGSNSSGPATYGWQTANGNIVSGGMSLNPMINQTGTYILTATATGNGCTASDMVTVGIDTITPVFTIQPAGLLTCTQLSSTITSTVQQPGAGNYSINWATANGNFASGQSSLSPVVDAAGTYILTIGNNLNGCTTALAVLVSQDTTPPTAVAAPAGDITCSQPSLNLSGTGSTVSNGVSYSWSSPNGQILSGGNSLTPNVGSPGTYTLLVTTLSNGCTASASTMVGSDITPPSVAIAQPGLLTCIQDSLVLNAAGSSSGPNFDIFWGTSGGNIVSGQGSLMVLINQAGNYILNIQNNQNGCTASVQVLVDQDISSPGAEAGTADLLHCNQTQIQLSGSSPSPGNMSYAWSSSNGNIVSGSTTAMSTVNAPGLYALTVTNPVNGCTATDDVSVMAIDPPSFVPALIQPDCHINTGMVDFGAVQGGQAPFEYSTNGGQSFGSQSLVSQLAPNTYALVVQDAFGCTATEAAIIDQPFLPTLSIGSVATLDAGDSIQLQPFTDILPGNVSSWLWTPADGLSCIDCESPWAMPLRSTTYTLIVTDQNGCDAEAEVQVLVNRKRNIYAPNVFSPNQDGENDYFMIFGKGVQEIQSLQVYDRWGTQLFLGTHLAAGDELAGWDGTYRGDTMNPAVFVWWAKVLFLDGTEEIYYGDVTLVR